MSAPVALESAVGNAKHPDGAFRVGFVLLDDFPLMSYASAMEPLRACNLLAGHTLYDIRHVPVEGARSTSSSGAVIGANAFLGEQVDFDLVLVVAGGALTQVAHMRLSSWLRLLASRGVMIGGVSGGPLVLAHAGIMEGRRMTVHWEHVQQLSTLSSSIVVERRLFIRDRDRLTCAGGTAALDMMHSLIAEHHGPGFARKISDWFVHTDIRPGDNAQRAGVAQRYNVTDKSLLVSIEAMENHLGDPLTLTQLATLAGLSARQLNRVFQQRLSLSTIQFYRVMRLKKSSDLLRTTSLSLDEVAAATGFAHGAHLSRLFSDHFGITPRRYRQRVGGPPVYRQEW